MQTSNTSEQPIPETRGLRAAMQRHPLFFFFLIAYAFSWVMLVPFILSEWGKLPGNWTIAFVLNPFVGPALAGYILTRVTEGKAGLLRLWRSLVQWRAGWQWYAFILLGIPVFFMLGVAIMPGALASFTGLTRYFVVGCPISFVVIFFLGGPLGEEIGWRGFALPHMQARFGALRASLLLGLLWTFWHLPHFLTSAQRGGPGTELTPFFPNLPIFCLLVMALTIIFTWVFNHTRGSVFLAVLLHASINTLSNVVPLFPVPAVAGSDLAMVIGWGALALIILLLTRGRLGYQPR